MHHHAKYSVNPSMHSEDIHHKTHNGIDNLKTKCLYSEAGKTLPTLKVIRSASNMT